MAGKKQDSNKLAGKNGGKKQDSNKLAGKLLDTSNCKHVIF